MRIDHVVLVRIGPQHHRRRLVARGRRPGKLVELLALDDVCEPEAGGGVRVESKNDNQRE